MITVQDLKNRKGYIIAKVTRIAGAENVKRYMTLMLWMVENEGNRMTGTVENVVNDAHFQLRERVRKTTKASEARSIEKLSWAETKFGKQHNF